ncbi:MAG: SulP family inorganic anion transporter, partial [Bacteroidetes bacterium]|nr:SulP family inorganic anion transporter [Bacteroidota bacterium]
LEEIPAGFQVTIDLKNTKLVDHSVMENLHRFEQDYVENGGTVQIIGLENHRPVSEHSLAARKAKS